MRRKKSQINNSILEWQETYREAWKEETTNDFTVGNSVFFRERNIQNVQNLRHFEWEDRVKHGNTIPPNTQAFGCFYRKKKISIHLSYRASDKIERCLDLARLFKPRLYLSLNERTDILWLLCAFCRISVIVLVHCPSICTEKLQRPERQKRYNEIWFMWVTV